MTESSPCPEPEVLGAFIDGRLSGEERRRVVVHLDSCADCYEVFSETVRFQGEEEPRGRVISSSRFGSRRWHWPAVAAVAMILVAVGISVVLLPMWLAETNAEALVATIRMPDDAELLLSRPPTDDRLGLEGFGPSRPSAETASFQAGVTLVQEAAAARLGVSRAGEEDVPAGRWKARKPFYITFGQWAEAGWLAAKVGDAEFFRAPIFIETRDEVVERDLPEDVSKIVAEIQGLTEGDGARTLDEAALSALEGHFKDLMGQY